MELFVGNITWTASEDDLAALFSPFGEIASLRILTDRETGKSRGIAFVRFTEESSAREAMEKLEGADLKGRPIRVSEAQRREDRPMGGGGGGGGGGGRGGYGGGGGRDRY